MSFADFKSAMKLARAFRELQETFKETQDSLEKLQSEYKRIRMEWNDHYDYTERAVGRWAKREQVDKKKAREEEPDAPSITDLDAAIKDGMVNVGTYRNPS